MEISVVADISVAIGTILLALVAFSALYSSRRQLQVLASQVQIQRSLLIPHLAVRRFHFSKNSVTVEIENISDAPAYWLGLATNFHRVYPKHFASAKERTELSESRVQQMIADKETVFVTYAVPSPERAVSFEYDGKPVHAQDAVNFSASFPEAMLAPHAVKSISFEPIFLVAALDGLSSQALDFDDLRRVLLQNDVPYVNMSFDVVFKDATENPVGGEHVDAFVLWTSEHRTLEEATAKHYTVELQAMTMGELRAKVKYISGEMYRNTWSSWNVPERFQKIG